MRKIAIAIFPIAVIAASEPAPPALDNPAYSTPPERWQSIDDAVATLPQPTSAPDPEQCSDRITHAREASGQPPLLNREAGSHDKPLAIYAVHREQDGCSVMVMMGDPDDIRPLPGPMEGPLQVIPAEADQ